MGSTLEEKAWATGIEGGAAPGTNRESFEGEAPRLMRIKDGFAIGRTEVTMAQFRRFVEESGYVSDAEKPGGRTQCFDREWQGYRFGSTLVQPWKEMEGKSWRDPNFPHPLREDFPVVCVSWNDARFLRMAYRSRGRRRAPPRRTRVPSPDRGRVVIRLPRRQQREPLFLVGE